jgi:hypothetical protein
VPLALGRTTVPCGVSVGVVRATLRATYCEYPVNRTTGKPSAITTSAPANTHSGNPCVSTSSRATIATTMNVAA